MTSKKPYRREAKLPQPFSEDGTFVPFSAVQKASQRLLKAVYCKGKHAELALDFVILDIWVAITLHSTSYFKSDYESIFIMGNRLRNSFCCQMLNNNLVKLTKSELKEYSKNNFTSNRHYRCTSNR